VAADVAVAVLIVVAAAIAGRCALLVVRLWRAAAGRPPRP